MTKNNAVINVMVNPVDISLEEYTFTLQNSKGTNTYLELGKPVQNVTPKALTRAESTPNIGLYDLSVKIKDGLNYLQNCRRQFMLWLQRMLGIRQLCPLMM